jgi:hypothetical protein
VAQRSSSHAVPVVLYFVGLVVLLVGVVPLLGREGGPLQVGLAVAGALLIALGIVLAARASSAVHNARNDREP